MAIAFTVSVTAIFGFGRMAGATQNWCCLGAHSVYTIAYNHAPVYSVTLFEATCLEYTTVCLAVICHLHFWQNDQDLLGAIAITRGWNGYRNKGQHGELTLEKKILPPLLLRLEPVTFC